VASGVDGALAAPADGVSRAGTAAVVLAAAAAPDVADVAAGSLVVSLRAACGAG
jgi:hypothetical protein